MKFQTTRNDLLNKLLFASKATSPKSTISVLGGIMFEVGDLLNIYSTDLETSIKGSMGIKVIKKGRAVVPAKVLLNILRSFPESKIEVELVSSTNQLKINCQNAIFTLNTYPVEEYPQFPEVKGKNSFLLNLEKLKNLISKVIISTSTDESRAILTGVLMEVEKNTISLCATDSYRLSLVKDEISSSISPLKVVIPAKVLDCILKSEFSNGEVEVNLKENQVSFSLKEGKNNTTTIISRLLSGKFPEYKQLIPTKFKHNVVIDKQKILEVVRRISSISQDNIPIKIQMYDGKITVFMNINEIGSSSENFSVAYKEEKIEIAFNPNFLIDGISIIDSEKIIFSIEESLKPVLIRPEKSENLLYLLMPIRIS